MSSRRFRHQTIKIAELGEGARTAENFALVPRSSRAPAVWHLIKIAEAGRRRGQRR